MHRSNLDHSISETIGTAPTLERYSDTFVRSTVDAAAAGTTYRILEIERPAFYNDDLNRGSHGDGVRRIKRYEMSELRLYFSLHE